MQKTSTMESKVVTKKTKAEEDADKYPNVRLTEIDRTNVTIMQTMEMPQLPWNNEIMSKLLEYLSLSVVTINCNLTGSIAV